jgi:hypothetical protein
MADQFGVRRAAPWYLYLVGVAALLWNAFGVFAWAATSFMGDTMLAQLPAEHRDYVAGLPAWSVAAWGVGVIGGVAGALLLLLRNRLAVPAFGASLLGAVANQAVYFTDPPPAGFFSLPLTVLILGFALFLFGMAGTWKQRGVIQ